MALFLTELIPTVMLSSSRNEIEQVIYKKPIWFFDQFFINAVYFFYPAASYSADPDILSQAVS